MNTENSQLFERCEFCLEEPTPDNDGIIGRHYTQLGGCTPFCAACAHKILKTRRERKTQYKPEGAVSVYESEASFDE